MIPALQTNRSNLTFPLSYFCWSTKDWAAVLTEEREVRSAERKVISDLVVFVLMEGFLERVERYSSMISSALAWLRPVK